LADAFIVGENFIDNDNVTMVLGDNIFEDDLSEDVKKFKSGGQVFAKKVTDPENLIPETMKSAQKIAGNGSVAAKVVKQVIRKGIHLDFKSATDMEASEFSKLFKHDVTKEGMAAFLEKRKPNW